MPTTIAIRITPQGLLIPSAALAGWDTTAVEAVQENDEIVIRRRPPETRGQVQQMLRETGLLYHPRWETPPHVSQEERARLAEQLAQGEPLSEIIIAD